MNFELWQIFVTALLYLSVLFAIAYCADKNYIPDSWISHPLVYVLSLGVFASGWAFYGLVTVAQQYGYGYLEFYFGLAVFFLLSPFIFNPIYQLCRNYQLSSLADLLTFRFRSIGAGACITVFMIIAMMPLLALQIQVVVDTTYILTQTKILADGDHGRHIGLAIVFCTIIILFTVLFGAGHLSQRRHNGLVAAIAFETVVKCVALTIVSSAAIFGIFGDFASLNNWLINQPELLNKVQQGSTDNTIRNLLLISFAAAIGMPHIFHMLFSEHPTSNAVKSASWATPLLLLFMSIPILPILWGAVAGDVMQDSDYFVLGIGLSLESPIVTMAAFIGGLSASSSVIIISTIALASMCLNHLILPYYQPDSSNNIYRWLLWVRRILIVGIILTGFSCYLLLQGSLQLADLAFCAFSGVLQFLPGVISLLYFPKVTRTGFLWGLGAGFVMWFCTLLLPILLGVNLSPFSQLSANFSANDVWSISNLVSLFANIIVLTIVSIYTRSSDEEKSIAYLCSLNNLQRPRRKHLSFTTSAEFTDSLASALGAEAADREVERALAELGITSGDARPYALRRLRDQLEVNLSGLLGASVARDMIDRLIPYTLLPASSGDDIRLLEARIEANENLSGVETELNKLRRQHRETLLKLPIGVCTLDSDQEILMWNQAMTDISGVNGEVIIGSLVHSLPAPWGQLIEEFSSSDAEHSHKTQVVVTDKPRWLTLHKARKDEENSTAGDQVILVEDITDLQMLEEEVMHNERLTSIGRLAAGVAHEIGNPVTGIACLAQNLRYETEPDEIKTAATDIITQTERIDSIVQSLVKFSHGGNQAPTMAHEIFSIDN